MAEATLNQENEALLAEMLRNAQEAVIQGSLETNPIVSRGNDDDAPVPMTVAELKTGGYIYVFDSRTGERIPILRYMAHQILNTRRPDGSFRFTVNDPGIRPKRGTFRCLLHAADPNRAEYDRMGFRVCKKEGIHNEYQQRLHMQKKHPAEWAAIAQKRKDDEDREDRELRRMLLQSQARISNLMTPDPAPTASVEPALEPAPDPVVNPLVCEVCGADFGSLAIKEKHKLTHK